MTKTEEVPDANAQQTTADNNGNGITDEEIPESNVRDDKNPGLKNRGDQSPPATSNNNEADGNVKKV
jgi:hypothetical protein